MVVLACKRNDMILKRLRKLHFLHQLEGLFLLLEYKNISVTYTKENKRSLTMKLFIPNVEKYLTDGMEYINETEESSKLTEQAVKFCEKNKIDSSVCKVFVKNISFKVKGRELWDYFDQFGKVLRLSIVKDRRTKKSKG